MTVRKTRDNLIPFSLALSVTDLAILRLAKTIGRSPSEGLRGGPPTVLPTGPPAGSPTGPPAGLPKRPPTEPPTGPGGI